MNDFNYLNLLKVGEQKDKTDKLCESINCEFPGSYCSLEDDDTPKCMCDKLDCINDKVKVCGEDGQTYASKCDLLKLSCAKQTNIKIAYIGQCSQGFYIIKIMLNIIKILLNNFHLIL
jgi:hypothetical protein